MINLEILLQLREVLTKLTLVLVSISSLVIPQNGTTVLGGFRLSGTTVLDGGGYVETISSFFKEIQSVIPQGGQIKTTFEKVRPEIKLEKCNGEASLVISYDGVIANGEKNLLDSSIEWKNTKQEVRAYSLN